MEARTLSRDRAARYRATQRKRGLRPFVLWRPNVNDPAYRARLAEECRRLARLTPDDDVMAGGFARLARRSKD
jgi:hypothetical protein